MDAVFLEGLEVGFPLKDEASACSYRGGTESTDMSTSDALLHPTFFIQFFSVAQYRGILHDAHCFLMHLLRTTTATTTTPPRGS